MAQMILHIRPANDSQRDANTLSRRGVQSVCLPLTEIGKLSPKLPNTSEISALIFTSRHAVLAFVDCIESSDWRRIPVFVVGKATAAIAREVGFVIIYAGSGGGAGLVPTILKHLPATQGRILWPAAVDRSFDMALALKAHGYHVETRKIYVAQPRVNFAADELQQLCQGNVSGVIVMSARSARLFCQLLDDYNLGSRRPDMTLIVGSSSIAAAAGYGWRQIHVAKFPRRSRLLAIATLFYHGLKQWKSEQMVRYDG